MSKDKRTLWTPPMDRLFIKLMVERVRDGQFLDGQFSKHAWKHMVDNFKVEFGPSYDIEVLKNHYRALKKNHIAIKTILSEGGFGWDKEREMIKVDDDNVWDDYIKAHPEFQMWRTKSMVGYNDLCTILCDRVKEDKYLKNEKSSARNGENLNGEGSKHLNLVGEGLEGLDKEMQNVENLSCKRTVWTLPMDRYFVKLLMDQVNDGQYLDGQFSKNAWKNMTDHFKAKFGSNYNIDVLKNHYRALKKNYSSIRILLGENGFTWDKDREMVKADDDHVWDDHIKAHPEFQMWRTKSLPGYDDLSIIFGDGGATGRFSHAPEDKKFKNGKPGKKNGENLNGEGSQSSILGGDDFADDSREPKNLDSEFEVFNQPKRSKSTPSSSRKSKKPRRSTGEGMVDAIQGMASAITLMASSKKRESHDPSTSPTHEGKLVAALEAVPDIDDSTFMQALDLLEDEKKAKIFLELGTNRRRGWLMYKLQN